MSTQTQAASSGYDNLKGLPQPSVKEMPKLALTGRIVKVNDPVVTGGGEGDYDQVEIVVEPTNQSRKINFIQAYWRPEYFSFGQFNPEDAYVNNPVNASFTEVKAGKKNTLGTSFNFCYNLNVYPEFKVDADGAPVINPKTNAPIVKGCPALMAVAGGTLEQFGNLVGVIKSYVAANGKPSKTIPGITEVTTKEIVDLLNQYIQENGEPEVAFVAKQRRDYKTGELTDAYEFDHFEGAFNTQMDERLQKWAASTAGKEGSKKLVIRYSV